MPKIKTHRGAAKRIKVSGKGKLMRRKAFHSHLLLGKSSKRKRRLKSYAVIESCDKRRIRRLLPYS